MTAPYVPLTGSVSDVLQAQQQPQPGPSFGGVDHITLQQILALLQHFHGMGSQGQQVGMGGNIPPHSRLGPEVTQVPDDLQPAFQHWLARNGVLDVDNPENYYDYRGAFMAGIDSRSANGHWPDTFKQHGHPTFSVESQYSTGPEDGGRWIGDFYVPPTRLWKDRPWIGEMTGADEQ